MNFETFFAEMKKGNHTIKIDTSESVTLNNLDNEALFQLPLLCLIILTMAKGHRKPIVSEIGHLVGETICQTMFNYKMSTQKIEWSANLRIRVIKAISFLEETKLILIPHSKGIISLTPLGKKLIAYALDDDSNLSYNLKRISRQYRNICITKKLESELV